MLSLRSEERWRIERRSSVKSTRPLVALLSSFEIYWSSSISCVFATMFLLRILAW